MEISRLSAEMMKTVLRTPDYAKPLEESGKVIGRYHIVGYHGGAWIFNVESNDELEMLLAGTRLQFLALWRLSLGRYVVPTSGPTRAVTSVLLVCR
jgi:hypothetical protein